MKRLNVRAPIVAIMLTAFADTRQERMEREGFRW